MAVPKYRPSLSRKRKRRSHHALKPRSGSVCPNCNEVKNSHCVCEACGHYRGKQVMEPRSATATFDAGSFEPEA